MFYQAEYAVMCGGLGSEMIKNEQILFLENGDADARRAALRYGASRENLKSDERRTLQSIFHLRGRRAPALLVYPMADDR